MNRKIFGIKISTYLTALAAIAFAFVMWFVTKNGALDSQAANALISVMR